MNLLSHAFFAREESDLFLLGTSIPDMLPMYDRKLKLQLLMRELKEHHHEQLLLSGIEHHISADNIFHTSAFFQKGQAMIRDGLQVIENIPIRRFFLAHILFEMLLDRFLILKFPEFIDRYYQLFLPETCEKIIKIISQCYGIAAADFQRFLEMFINSRFLYSYRELRELVKRAGRVIARINRTGEQLIDEKTIDEIAVLLESTMLEMNGEITTFFAQPLSR